MLMAWGPWVRDAVQMMDGYGAWAHYPAAGGLMDQVARDMTIYNVARGRWVEMRNKDKK